MSEQEQQQTPQVEEAAKDIANVQKDSTPDDAPAPAEKTVESTENQAVDEETKKVEDEVKQVNDEAAVESADDSETKVTEAKATNDEDKKEEVAGENGKPSEEKSNDAGANGDLTEEKTESSEVAEGETNGLHKRKAENGTEPVDEDEKSPKKAKVVEEADQTKVEETAA